MSRKKKLFIIFILILIPSFIIGAYLNRQLWYLNHIYYREYYPNVSLELATPGEVIRINTSQVNDYIELDNIMLGDFFKDFEERTYSEESLISRRTFVKINEEANAAFIFGKYGDEYFAFSIINYFIYIMSDDSLEVEFNPHEFLDKYSIDNDFDLIKLIINTDRNNIFTPVSQMRENAIRNYFAEMLEGYNKISLVEGDYSGRMFTVSNFLAKELIIEYENEFYFFSFLNLDYFTESKIQEIINTIIIN